MQKAPVNKPEGKSRDFYDTKVVKLLGNNRGDAFLEHLLIILMVVMVIAIPAYGLALVISDNIVAVVDRVNQIGTP